MAQSKQLVETLKKELRASGITYLDVAKKLKLSEASVKRLFSENSFSLQRFENICELAGLTITDLVEINLKKQHRLEQLTLEQEKEVANDLVLLIVVMGVMNGMTFKQITGHYKISDSECIRKLARLDKLRFLELLPGNRFRMLISSNFRWHKDGPIQNFFMEKVEKDFFNTRFKKDQEKLLVVAGLCTAETNKRIQDKLEIFSQEMNDLLKQDLVKPLTEKKANTLVIALREWQFSMFRQMARDYKE